MPLRSETPIIHRIVKILLLMGGMALSVSSQTVYVPSSHWVYDFLDRMEAARALPVVLGSTRPMTRAEIVSHLQRLIDQESNFDHVTRDQLDYLRFEFSEEQSLSADGPCPNTFQAITKSRWIDPWLPDFIYPRGRHLLEIEHPPLKLYWDPIFYRSRLVADVDSVADRERVNIDSNGFLLWGTVGQHAGFYVDIRDTREWGTRAYPVGNATAPQLGFVQGNGRQIYHDETIAYILYQWRYFSLFMGKDYNLWGPGKSGQLMLSDYATSYDQIKVQLTLSYLKLTSLIAWLKAYSPEYYLNGNSGRMMAAHRLEFSPFRFVDFGVQETVIYAGRQFEPAYANPVMFFRSAEHYLGDHDNVTMGLDFEFKFIPRSKLYGELFVDDLTTQKLGTDFYGNKYGYTAGFHHINLLQVPQLDIRCEYTRLRPFTYSHKDPLTSYQHFSTVLGHWIGPNADIVSGDLSYRLSYRTLFLLQFERLRHGENTSLLNVGGDADVPHESFSEEENAPFLAGILNRSSRISLKMSYEPLRNLFLHVEYSWTAYTSELPKDNALNSGHRQQVVLGFSLNK